MYRYRILELLIVSIMFISCSRHIFEDFDPDQKLTSRCLEKDGYKRIWGVDVLMFEREQEGLNHILQFYDMDGLVLGVENWVITSDFVHNEDVFEEMLDSLGFYPITELNIKKRVAVSNIDNNLVYLASINNDNQLRIVYHHKVADKFLG